MKKLFSAGLLALLLLIGAACSMPEPNEALLELNENMQFGGVLLGMTKEQMTDALGEPDAENISIGGTEYSYHDEDISALIADDGTIKRLSSKSADVLVFDIAVGSAVEEAAFKLADLGYAADAAGSYRYNKNEVQLILLTIDGREVLGFTVEWLA